MISNEYKNLFLAICENLEVAAETAMETHKKNNDLTMFKTSKEMRDKYARLNDKISVQGIEALDKQNYLDLLVGSFTVINQFKDKINKMNAVIEQYEKDLIPKITQKIKEFNESNN